MCGSNGQDVGLPTGRSLCVYRHPIVIETGFSCPAERLDLWEYAPAFATCSNFGTLRGIERDYLVDRFGVPGRPWTVGGFATPTAEPTNQLDLLWVIDNSGSMCEEQELLRNNFDTFLDGLAAARVDFHLAVTTTHMAAGWQMEPVARPGHLQSQPQPVPGFDPSCHSSVEGDFGPVRAALRAAVACMHEPDEQLLDVTDAQISCALHGQPAGCEIVGVCGGSGERCEAKHLFPDPTTYRAIPTVMRSQDYQLDDASVDVASLSADFACASFVGTRGLRDREGVGRCGGRGVPELATGVNRGFVRPDARFAVMFITDENDCTHDGTLPEDSVCGGDVCEYWNREDLLGGPLTPIIELKSQMLGNLSVTKGRAVGESEVWVGSIHGAEQRYAGPPPEEASCEAPDYTGIEPSCDSALGVAYSGDRYVRFLAQFENSYPVPQPDGSTVGLMCEGDFSPALGALGDWLAGAVDPR